MKGWDKWKGEDATISWMSKLLKRHSIQHSLWRMESRSSSDGVGGFSGGGFHEHGDWRRMVESQEEIPRPILLFKKRNGESLKRLLLGLRMKGNGLLSCGAKERRTGGYVIL